MSLFTDASLVMIPSGIKDQKIYSVTPTDGSGDLTFTRSNDTATRVASNGLIEKVRTNLILQSQTLDNASWDKSDATVTANTTIAPDGTLTADTITAVVIDQRVNQAVTVAASTEYTFSFFAKKGTTVTPRYSVYDLSNAAFILTQVDYSALVNTSTWSRITATFTTPAGCTSISIYPINAATLGTTFIWGCQLETGVTTDYIATTTAAVSVGPVADLPRLDYTDSTCPRLLLEPQRTNVITFSEQMDNAAWTKVRGAVTANSTISPSGFQDADTFASAPAQAFPPAITRSPTYTGNTNYTLSIFAKVLGNTNIFSLGYVDNATGFTGGSAVYNLATQVVTITQSPNASVTASMVDYGSGWYRLSLSFLTIAAPTFNYFQIGQTTNDVANGFALWGAQLEEGAYATSYVNTLNSAVTRGADAASKTSASALIGQTEGTIFWEFEFTTSVAAGHESFINIDAGAGFGDTIYIIKTANGTITAEMYLGGVQQASFSLSSQPAGTYKAAIGYANNNTAFFLNGVQVGTTDTSCSVPATSRIQLGNGVFGASMDKTAQVLLFPTRLSNADLAALTA
jgi:hypothetical protein